MNLVGQYTETYKRIIESTETIRVNGKVTDVIGLVIVSSGPNVSLGEVCTVIDREGKEVCKSEVVGFKDGKVLSIALGEVHEISPACEILASGRAFRTPVGEGLLGRDIS